MVRSLRAAYGVENVPFFHAQPTAKLLLGITPARIEGTNAVEFDEWPKSLKDVGGRIGTVVGK